MHDIIKAMWEGEQRKLPRVNCIVYSDGTVTVLNFIICYSPNNKTSHVSVWPLCDTTIDSMLRYNPDIWTSVDEWSVISDESGTYLSGDGAFGNKGFVAHLSHEGQLAWAMFFDGTNPIRDLKINAGHLIGQSERGDARLEINLKQITDIRFIYYKTEQVEKENGNGTIR